MNGNLEFYASLTEWTPWDEAAVLKMQYLQRAELAKSITCIGLLVDLSMDQHFEVRKGVAENPRTPLTTLRRLAEQDFCGSVKDAAKYTLSALI
ncbi:hypothetical protein QWY16_14055 [Planococcus shenhongbingii]|uniref:Uncharacterized protein n=1 Tax=Planococcus shenhongbingii TaxID=3058398 RepID=A0ABT8N977_9BACL|nr:MULTISPECIES: hypothetical protein [unclassified Planococcus (in: firmicutes)]MDN7244453.1 hypothetical protein [Planococcus sp. N017]WKA57615.1 hypothetical protein QWY16_14055 [Planococcus sp. N016]